MQIISRKINKNQTWAILAKNAFTFINNSLFKSSKTKKKIKPMQPHYFNTTQ